MSDVELIRRVEALRRPLELAAKDNFGGVRKIAGLGVALRAACDGVIAKAPPGADALAAWREILARWEQLGEDQQAVEVARGMRLVARFGKPAAAEAEAGSGEVGRGDVAAADARSQLYRMIRSRCRRTRCPASGRRSRNVSRRPGSRPSKICCGACRAATTTCATPCRSPGSASSPTARA